MAQEIIRATVPANNKWHTEDLEAKAAALGMDKGEMMLMAVDMLINFDEVFFKKIKEAADQLNIPIWRYIQCRLIKLMGTEAGEVEFGAWTSQPLNEFIYINEGTGYRAETAEEEFNRYKNNRIKELQNSGIKERHDFFVSESERLKKGDEK